MTSRQSPDWIPLLEEQSLGCLRDMVSIQEKIDALQIEMQMKAKVWVTLQGNLRLAQERAEREAALDAKIVQRRKQRTC